MMNGDIQTLLNTYDANVLVEMAKAADIPVLNEGTRKKLKKADLVERMANRWLTPYLIQRRYESLNVIERTVLHRVQMESGRMQTTQLKRKMLRMKVVTEGVVKDTSYRARYKGSPRPGTVFEDVVARLTLKGLLFSEHRPDIKKKKGAPRHGFNPDARFLIIPPLIMLVLPDPSTLDTGREAWNPERVEAGNSQTFIRDLYLYWTTVRRNPIKLLKTGMVGKKDMKAINGSLLTADPSLKEARSEQDTTKLYFLRSFLQRKQLLVTKHGEVSAQTGKFWELKTEKQVGEIAQGWANISGTGRLGKDVKPFLPRYHQATKAWYEKVLPKLRDGVWYDVDELHERLLDADDDFLFHRTTVEKERYDSVYKWISEVGEYLRGDKATLLADFTTYELMWIQDTIQQFAQFGVVDVGYNGDQIIGMRLTNAGYGAFHPKKKGEEKVKTGETGDRDRGNVIVQPSFQILAMGGVPIQALAKLDDVAERVKVDVNAFEYRLTRDSVYRAQEMGMDAPAVKLFLTEINGNPLPQNIGRSLDEWADKHERIVFRTDMVLLQTADFDLLNRLINDDKIGKSLARPLMDDVALVHPKHLKPLTRTLTKQGMMPVVTDARPESADHSVNISNDGVITPIHAVPSLHLRGRLAQIAVAQPNNRWQLTEETIRKVGTGKVMVTKTLAELAKLQVGALSGELQLLVKRWGGYYGTVAAETITLVQFQDHDTLTELLQHPDLRGLLTPFPLSDKPLATVEQVQLPHVQMALAQFGVVVELMLGQR